MPSIGTDQHSSEKKQLLIRCSDVAQGQWGLVMELASRCGRTYRAYHHVVSEYDQ